MRRVYIYLFLAVISSVLGIPDRLSALECVNTKFIFDIEPGANQPSDIAEAPNGDLYIVDGVNNRIIVMGADGRWKFSFGSGGSGKGNFMFPVGIDISASGNVFIADSGNHRIQVFDLKGNFIRMFPVRQDAGEVPPDPVDVLASKLGNTLYIADNENHKIKVYTRDGVFKSEFGQFGEDLGKFRFPGIMVQNDYNEIFIVDVLNTRVQKFDPFGKFISSIGSWGVLQGNFFRPKGVAIDKKNRVFVTDSYMGVIQAFTDLGRFIGVVCKDNEKRVFKAPVGILINKKDRMLVVEMRANKVTALKILE